MPTLLHDTFDLLEIGTISTKWPYSAEGEYHVVEPPYDTGVWEEANISTRWGRGAGCWAVVPDGDRRAMEATFTVPIDTPLLVAGSRFWDDYLLAVDVRPLGWIRPLGLVVRYQHSRQYYFLALYPDHVALLKRDHEEETVLAEAPWQGSVDRYVAVEIACRGRRMTVRLDGVQVLSAQDDAYPRGRIGLLAEGPARFADVRVTASAAAARRAAEAEEAWAREEAALQAALPQPVLWKVLSTAGFGTDRNLRYGDLNGDGRMEIVVPQALHRGTPGEYAQIICVTALDLDGIVLWQHGQPTVQQPKMLGDLCIQVYDWNGDGKAEVLFTQDFRLKVLDGATGQVLQEIPTPYDEHLREGEPYARTFGDSIYFCDLEGRGERRNLLLKDRYKTVWAYDQDLNLLWSHVLNTGHYPIAYDVDEDGKEEVLVGYSLIDHDGTVLWTLPLKDHMDGAFMGRLEPGGPVRICMGCSDEGYVMADVAGNILVQQLRGHCQGASIGRFEPDRGDVQIATITFWHHPGIMTTYDTEGRVLAEVEPLQIGSILPPVDWAGDGRAWLLHNTHPQKGGLMDIHGRRGVVFPDDGHPVLCSEALDIDSDGHQEVLTWDFQSIWIYRADPAVVGAARGYDATPVYNNSNYRGRWLI
jgi:rhamnogalacturonan endolyase